MHPIAELVHLAQVVADEDHADVLLLDLPDSEILDLPLLDDGERGGRLVEQQHLLSPTSPRGRPRRPAARPPERSPRPRAHVGDPDAERSSSALPLPSPSRAGRAPASLADRSRAGASPARGRCSRRPTARSRARDPGRRPRCPCARDSRGEWNVTSSPSTKSEPSVGRSAPQRIFRSVDLPAPLSPTRPTTSPRLTSMSTSCSAARLP